MPCDQRSLAMQSCRERSMQPLLALFKSKKLWAFKLHPHKRDPYQHPSKFQKGKAPIRKLQVLTWQPSSNGEGLKDSHLFLLAFVNASFDVTYKKSSTWHGIIQRFQRLSKGFMLQSGSGPSNWKPHKAFPFLDLPAMGKPRAHAHAPKLRQSVAQTKAKMPFRGDPKEPPRPRSMRNRQRSWILAGLRRMRAPLVDWLKFIIYTCCKETIGSKSNQKIFDICFELPLVQGGLTSCVFNSNKSKTSLPAPPLKYDFSGDQYIGVLAVFCAGAGLEQSVLTPGNLCWEGGG